MTLGERIRMLRTAKAWSSGQLAEESGVSRAYLWQLETGGKDKPSFDVLERLARALGVSVSEFSEEKEQPERTENLPPGLAECARHRGKHLGIRKTDLDVMQNIHFRGHQPDNAEDWELLFLFLKKWAR